MKNTLIFAGAVAALALTGTPAAAQVVPATENATATARIFTPLQLTKDEDLDFGTIVISGTGFTGEVVSVSQAGAVTCGGGANLVCDDTLASAAAFTVSGTRNQSVTVSVPASVPMNGSNGGSLTLTPDAPGTAALDLNGDGAFSVGGAISIDDVTVDGVYTGNFDVTVQYP